MTKPVAGCGHSALALVLAVTFAGAQPASAADIYVCVDANGRTLTADRPVPECLDREQRVLNPSGTVRQKLAPLPTAQELAAQEIKDRQALDDRGRADEEKRRLKLMVLRYPTKASYERARTEALVQPRSAIKAATARLAELKDQAAKLDEQMDFYKKDPAKLPPYLRRQAEDQSQSIQVVKRTIADQEEEIRRINRRFDDDLVRLRGAWTVSMAKD